MSVAKEDIKMSLLVTSLINNCVFANTNESELWNTPCTNAIVLQVYSGPCSILPKIAFGYRLHVLCTQHTWADIEFHVAYQKLHVLTDYLIIVLRFLLAGPKTHTVKMKTSPYLVIIFLKILALTVVFGQLSTRHQVMGHKNKNNNAVFFELDFFHGFSKPKRHLQTSGCVWWLGRDLVKAALS